MMIEIAGASGAGKSTIADLVQGLLQEKGVQALPVEEAGPAILRRLKRRTPWRRVKAWQGLRFSLEHPALVWIAVAAQWGRPIPWHHRRLALRWFLRTGGLYRFFRCHLQPNEAVVFGEGLVHRTVSLFTSDQEPPSAEAVVRYMQRLPRSDLLIVLEVPPAVCVERLKGRELPVQRLQGLGVEALSPFVEHAAEAVTIAGNEARRDNWPLLVIDNTAPLAQVQEKLRAYFLNLATSTNGGRPKSPPLKR